jgi:hypothetical protein
MTKVNGLCLDLVCNILGHDIYRCKILCCSEFIISQITEFSDTYLSYLPISFISNGTSTSHKNNVKDEVLSSRLIGCVCDLS